MRHEPECLLRDRRHVLHVERLSRRRDAGSQEDPPAAARHGPRHGRRLHKRHGHVRCARRLQRRRLHQHRSSRAEPRLPSDCLDGCDLHGGGQRDLYLRRLRRQLHRDRSRPRPRLRGGRRCGRHDLHLHALRRAAFRASAARICLRQDRQDDRGLHARGRADLHPHGRCHHRARRADRGAGHGHEGVLLRQRLGLRLRLYGRRLQLRRLQTYRRRHLHLLLVHQQPDVRHVCPCRPRRGGPL